MICYNLASPDGVENLQSLAEEIAEVFDLGENVFLYESGPIFLINVMY